MKREIKIYKHYLARAFMSKLSYKTDSIISAFSFVLSNGIAFFTLSMIIGGIPLESWSFDWIVFLYAFSLIPKSIDHTFTDKIWALGGKAITDGELDQYLTKPLNPLFQFVASDFRWDGLGEAVLGLVFIFIYAPRLAISWSFHIIAPLIICAFFAIFVFMGIKIMTGSLSFWIKRSIAIMSAVYNLVEFVKFPIDLMGKAIKIILFYIVPFGLVIFFPVRQVLYGAAPLTMWLTTLYVALGSITLFILSLVVFKRGLRRYESAGS